jgi:hypothetical protein
MHIRSRFRFRFDFRIKFSAWFALIVVLNRTTPATAPNIVRYAKSLGIEENEQDAASAFATCAEPLGHSATECTQTGCSECGNTTHKSASSFGCPTTVGMVRRTHLRKFDSTRTFVRMSRQILRCQWPGQGSCQWPGIWQAPGPLPGLVFLFDAD